MTNQITEAFAAVTQNTVALNKVLRTAHADETERPQDQRAEIQKAQENFRKAVNTLSELKITDSDTHELIILLNRIRRSTDSSVINALDNLLRKLASTQTSAASA